MDEIDFLFGDKHQSFLQVSTIIFDLHNQTWPKFPKWQVCNNFTIWLYALIMSSTHLKLIHTL